MARNLEPNTPQPIWLDDPRARDARVVGSKAANLAAVASHLLVPRGLCIPTAAFALASSRLRQPLSNDETGTREQSGPLPEGLGPLLAAECQRLTFPVAVRSSCVAEDLPSASFAGQYRTRLNVGTPRDLPAAIWSCWSSVFSSHVAEYYEHAGFDAKKVRMGVLIQEMVVTESSGVAFTRNPVSGEHMVMIEAVRGLGEALVSGRATPDRYVVRPSDVVQALRTGRQREMTIPAPGGFTITVPVTPATRQDAVLDAGTARRIAHMARTCEQIFRTPQDIEWAVDQDQQLFLLQSRPITSIRLT